MKIYVAHRTDVEPSTRMASGSMTKLKELMKETKEEAEFTVVLHNVKPNVENFCKAIVDVTDLDAEESWDFRLNQHGQLRKA